GVWPSYVGALEARIENEKLPSLMKSRAGLGQSAGRFAGLDDYSCLRQGAHRYVAFGEEKSIEWNGLILIAQDRNLRDNQKLARDPVLQLAIFRRVVRSERSSEYCDCSAVLNF